MTSNFWDFCAPFYDIAEKMNGRSYGEMLKLAESLVPKGATVLEAAAGTGAISIAVSGKASSILCTDISEKMLNVARRKIKKRDIGNIEVASRSIYDLGEADNAFDIVIAGQVLHLVDEPQKAANELRRIAKSMIILPMSFTKNLRGISKLSFNLYKLLGFAPRVELAADEYGGFLAQLGFEGCEIIQIDGRVPMAIAIEWGAAQMNGLSSMRNIGKTLEKKLISVGITTAEELMAVGSEGAFVRLKLRYPDAKGMSLVHMYAIEGAISDTDFNRLPDDVKQRLKEFCDNLR